MSFYFLVGLWTLRNVLPANIQEAGSAALFLMLLLIGVLILFLISAPWIAHKLRNRSSKMSARLAQLMHGVLVLRQRHLLWKTALQSMVIWGLQFFWTWVVFREVLGQNFWALVVGTSLPIISTAIPIQGLASFGTFEAVWMLVFVSLGIEKTRAIASGLSFHLLTLVYVTLLGCWGIIDWYVQQSAQGRGTVVSSQRHSDGKIRSEKKQKG